MSIKKYFAVSLVLLAVTSGCVLPRTEPGYGVDIGFSGDIERQSGAFEMNGSLTVGGGNAKLDAYRNVSVFLYSNDTTLIGEEEIGVLEGRTAVDIRSQRQPQYVIINSPDFWEEPQIEVDYYVWSDEHQKYGIHEASSRDEFPIELPEDGG